MAKRERSAGGVVVKDDQVVVIVPRGRETLALPKGHIDPGEDALAAATREVREETGVVAESLGPLGDVEYWYSHRGKRIDKVVTFFLFKYRSGDLEDHDDEVEEARWLSLEKASEQLAFAGEREMIRRAIERLLI